MIAIIKMSGVTGLRYAFARYNDGSPPLVNEPSPLFELIGNDFTGL